MSKKIYLLLLLVMGLFISLTKVDAAPLLSNPYVIPTDQNNELGKEIPLNLVNLQYVGENIQEDIFYKNKVATNLGFFVKKNEIVIIKNMGIYKKETIDLNIKFLSDAYLNILPDGTTSVNVDDNASNMNGVISFNVYQHDTKTIYPDLYIGYSDQIKIAWGGYVAGDSFGYQNLYGLYIPKDLGTVLASVDLMQHDGVLDLRYGKGDSKNPETVYPIFKNATTGFVRGKYFGGNLSLKMFDPEYPSPIPIPYEGATVVDNQQDTTEATSLDVMYRVTQKLANYVNPSQYPSDQTFKIKTNFERTSIEDFPVEVEVKLLDNQVVDEKYYSSASLENNLEVAFSTDFLKDYKGKTIKIEYKQRIDSKKIQLMDYYSMDEKAFVFPYSTENKWERRGELFNQEQPSTGQTKIKFPIELSATNLNGQIVIQNKSTDEYDPLDFISDLTSNIPNDVVSAVFTKKVVFENEGEQELYVTLKSSLSSATKDIVVKVVVIEGTLHFTEVPSELLFPTITLTGKMSDYEVLSFNQGRLSVSDARLTKSPWSLAVTLTENKTSNNFGDILYFRNEEGTVYNITNQTQNVMTNRNLEPIKTIIDYEKNKKIGLFIRSNPLLVKKGAYEGSVTWSLVDAPE